MNGYEIYFISKNGNFEMYKTAEAKNMKEAREHGRAVILEWSLIPQDAREKFLRAGRLTVKRRYKNRR